MADTPEAIQKAKKLYFIIGAILFGCTIATVAVATVPILDIGKHGFDTADMILGFAIASFKAGLVMFIFMHLNHEKSMIYYIFGLGIVIGVVLMALTALALWDPIIYEKFLNPFA